MSYVPYDMSNYRENPTNPRIHHVKSLKTLYKLLDKTPADSDITITFDAVERTTGITVERCIAHPLDVRYYLDGARRELEVIPIIVSINYITKPEKWPSELPTYSLPLIIKG